MNELVEMIRRDHALLDDLAGAGDDERFESVLEAHEALLDQTIAPLAEQLGPPATDEWSDARGLLPDVRAHAEQMEQVVLPRLTSELDEASLSDATREVMRRHEALGLGSSRPSGMRADLDADHGDDSSHPAGA